MDAPFPDDMMPCIKDFFANVHPRLEPGLDVYPDVFHSARFYPLQRMNETAKMIRLARSINPRVVMEIGADKGGGLYHWCQCLPSVDTVIACEIRGCPYKVEFERAFPHIRFLWMEQSSYKPGAPWTVASWLDGAMIDVLFIDGDKTAFDRDFELYSQIVSPDGMVFLHDVVEQPVLPVWRRLQARYRTDHIIDTDESAQAIMRERRGEPETSPYDGWLRYWKGRSCTVGVVWPGEKK